MIARIWRGRVRASDVVAYQRYIAQTGLRDYRSTQGNRGAYILTRVEGDVAHVITLSVWDNLESIRAFAGDDVTLARYYPEDQRYLLDFPKRVEHYEVYGGELLQP
jgi:heme-degrading monooxygenase HmoA